MIQQLHQLYQEVTNILKNHPFNISKNLKISHRLYQNKCIAIDISDGYLRFALDVGFENDEASSIYVRHFVRNTNTERVIRKTEQYRAIQSNTEQYRAIQSNTGKYRSLIIQAINDWLAVYQELFAIKVSVIIPTYNRAHVLPRLLKSINEQTADKDSFEVIFVDDCSSDNTIEVIQSTLNSDIHYQVHKLPINSGGASIPRNLGMKLAKGEYLFFMDSDDNIYPYTIADSIEYIEKINCDCLYLKFDSPNDRSLPERVFQAGSVENADVLLHHLSRSLNPMKFYRNSMLQIHRIVFPLFRSNEDRIFNTEIICHANKFSILADKPYISWFDTDEVSLTVYSHFTMADYIKVTQTIFAIIDNASLDFIKKLKIFNAMMRLVFDLIIRFHKKERDVSHWIRIVLCHAHIMGVYVLEEYLYPGHKEMFRIFQQYDTYGVIRTQK